MSGRSPNLKLLCGLWRSVGKGGMEYLKGRTSHSIIVDAGHTLFVFPNSKPTKPNSPQFFLYSAPPLQGNAEGRVSPSQEGVDYKVGSPPEQGNAGDEDDKVPF